MIIEPSILESVFYQSSIPQMISEYDLSQHIVNNAFYDFIGYSKEEWSHLTLKDITHPEDYELCIHLFHELITGSRQSYQIEKRYFHKSGEIIWGALHVTRINDTSAAKQYFLSQVFDITEEKNISRVLSEREQKYRLLAENSSDVINLHLKDGRFIYTSPSITQILGYEIEELIGESPYLFIHPEDVSKVEAKHFIALANKIPILATYRMKKKDGTYIWLETNIRAVVDEQSGEISGIISISRNIEKRIEKDRLLRKSDKLAVVGQLASAVAHEIRNPLTSVKGFMQLFSATKEYKEEHLRIVLDEIDRVESIISEFLTIARPHKERLEPVKVDELMHQVIQLVQSQAILSNKQIEYVVKTDHVPLLNGDANSLKHVFFNTIQNALEAIGEKGTVIVTIELSDSDICIRVTDNGCGTPEKRLNKLGEPFYLTKEKGITSYKIIEHHRGKIDIDSDIGKGTTVSILLPI